MKIRFEILYTSSIYTGYYELIKYCCIELISNDYVFKNKIPNGIFNKLFELQKYKDISYYNVLNNAPDFVKMRLVNKEIELNFFIFVENLIFTKI